MLVKLLGAVDFIGGLILIFISGFHLPSQVLILFGILFLIKSLIGMLKEFGSWIDCAAGILFFLLLFFPVHWIICVIVGILVIQKGIFSFL